MSTAETKFLVKDLDLYYGQFQALKKSIWISRLMKLLL